MAVLGSLDLEFTRLSQVTGDPRYVQAADIVMDQFELWQNQSGLPGMLPLFIDATGPNGIAWLPSSKYTIGALADSAYEYLIKVSYALFRPAQHSALT